MKSLGKGVLLGIGGAVGVCMCLAVAVFAFAGMGASSTASTAGSSAGTSGSATNNSSASVGALGDRMVSGGIALTVLNVERVNDLSDFQQAEEGNHYVKAEVLIENIERDEAPYNPMYFSLKDDEGIEYNVELYAADGSLQSGDLFKGDKVRGVVAFKTKQDAADLVLSYEPIVLLGGYETIRVQLPQ